MLRRSVLLIAYEFPPVNDAGAFRPAAFAKYLPSCGYTPVVIARNSTANRKADPTQLAHLPRAVRIERIDFAHSEDWTEYLRDRLKWVFPIEKALKLKHGTISDALAWRLHRWFPDVHLRKTWTQPAIETALRAVDQHHPEAIVATAPPFESFEVGYAVSRDPFTYGQFWDNLSPRRRRRVAKLERRFVEWAARVIVVTPSMLDMMVLRYEDARNKVVLITNGFDDYLDDSRSAVENVTQQQRMTIAHIGTLTSRRWPAALLKALQLIRDQQPEAANSIRIQFVGACHFDDGALLKLVNDLGISSMVDYRGLVSYPESQKLMRQADTLLLFEPTERHALTGKLFEYIGARKPIIGLVPHGSDAAELIVQGNCGTVVDVEDPRSIATTICEHWQAWRRGELRLPAELAWSNQFHRRTLTRILAELLEDVSGSRHSITQSNERRTPEAGLARANQADGNSTLNQQCDLRASAQ
jgi:glycosyltransferase involved in cell wall biosynthesis